MSLPLPNLDNRTYADLVEEARSLIPGEYAHWTDHNPTDPGIILIEMLAWLSEMVLYRVDRVPEKNIEAFLKLLNEPAWQLPSDLELFPAIRDTIVKLRERYRAVSSEDFEQLVLKDWPRKPEAKWGVVKRVKCFRELNLQQLGNQQTSAPGHVSIVVIPDIPVLEFAGKTYVVVSASLGNALPALTLEGWIKTSLVKGKMNLFGQKDGMELLIDNGKLVAKTAQGGKVETDYPPDGNWHHVVLVGTGTTLLLYIDGKEQGREEINTNNYAASSDAFIGAGVKADGSSQQLFSGKIIEVRVWNKVRSVVQIQADMHRQLTGTEPGLIGYWRLDEGAGNTAIDRSSGRHNGTISSPQWSVSSTYGPDIARRPSSNPSLLGALWTYLDERRLLTTRHHVVEPDYVKVAIAATVHLKAGTRPDKVRAEAVGSIVHYFDPLHGGTEGKGWPFGRDVYLSELYGLLDNVPGVDYVETVTLQGDTTLKSVTITERQLVAVEVSENSFTIT